MGFPVSGCHVIPGGDWHPWVFSNPDQLKLTTASVKRVPIDFSQATAVHLQFVHNDILGGERRVRSIF